MENKIEKRINELYQEHGTITPDIVVEDAKNPKSPLHDCFEWDIEKAAMSAWREQARRLIRSVTIVVTTQNHNIAVPRYVRSPEVSSRLQSYSDTAILKTDKERAIDAMVYEIERLESILYRVEKMAIALHLENEYKEIMSKITAIRKKIA